MLYVLQYIELGNAIKQTLGVFCCIFPFFFFGLQRMSCLSFLILYLFILITKKDCTDMHKQLISYKISCITCFKKKGERKAIVED